jgi:hypothetical protein
VTTTERLHQALARLANPAGFVSATVPALAVASGMGESSVKRGLAELLAAGTLERVTQSGGRMANVYRLRSYPQPVHNPSNVSELHNLGRVGEPPPPLRGVGVGAQPGQTLKNEPVEPPGGWPRSRITDHATRPVAPGQKRPQCVNPRCGAPRLTAETDCPWCGVAYP